MQITSISLANFRCFKYLSLSFNGPITLIEGDNGSGKTSILEALHYGCYLRSFRTSIPMQLIHFNEQNFCIKISGTTDHENWNLTAGFSSEKRRVTLNEKSITSYKLILDRYRVMTITEDDLDIIRGYPVARRTFLDMILFMLDPSYSHTIRKYEKIVRQRNSILEKNIINLETYSIFTQQCKDLSAHIQERRQEILTALEQEVNNLLRNKHKGKNIISCIYKKKEWHEQSDIREKQAQKTLYGAHLDDIEIIYNHQYSRHFASRGQQKMLVIILKLAALNIIQKPALMLVDDFMTDLDQNTIEQLVSLLVNKQHQLIITCPLLPSNLATVLKKYTLQTISLSPLPQKTYEKIAIDKIEESL